jgi:homoserine kinase type II
MVTGAAATVLDLMAVRPDKVALLKDVPSGNGNWLVEMPDGQRVVLRRYHPGANREDLAYEHAVLGHLASTGWTVPHRVGDPVCHDGRWYCLTRYVPGQPAMQESTAQRRRRGRDLARLDLALRGLGARIGQRPGWRPQHSAIAANAGLDWQACVRQLTAVSPRLGSWAQAAAEQTRAALAAIGAGELPVTVIHGDFAAWNVHYQNGRLVGVIDFGLAHQDSRPYELAIARTYRAPETADAYRDELARSGWPLSGLEETAIAPVYHAFRLDMAASEIGDGLTTGRYNLAAIERQLARTGVPQPLRPGASLPERRRSGPIRRRRSRDCQGRVAPDPPSSQASSTLDGVTVGCASVTGAPKSGGSSELEWRPRPST